MFYYNGKEIRRVGFLGFGKSNLGIFSYLSGRYDFEVTLRASTPIDASHICPKFAYFGKDALSNIDEDILFLSPSVRRDVCEIEIAQSKGILISSDAEFFFENSQSDVYAVTGSDGKSTTSYLTSYLLKNDYKNTVCCGNIGESMTPHLNDPSDTAYTTELSSFQLMYLSPKNTRCVITNITPNHLNWHKSFEEYITAKTHILENSKERIFNFDCNISRNIAKSYKVFAVFSKNYSEDYLRKCVSADLYITLCDGSITVCGEKILKATDIFVSGEHNVLNFMAAIAMSYGKARKKDIENLAKTFRGLPHRCEFVCESNGVKFYDSSIDSSPNRCAATLKSMQNKVILILGGRSKGLDYKELLSVLEEKTRFVVLTGEVGEKIKELIIDNGCSGIKFEYKHDFYDAIERAAREAKTGDTVLLSPAATSFDRFSNFEERGNAFKEHIRYLNRKDIKS